MDDTITLGEVSRALARIERKLDDELSDHEARLRKLEQWMWASAAAAATGAVSGVYAFLEAVLGGRG